MIEKLEFLSKKVIEFDKLSKEMEAVFPEKSYKECIIKRKR